MKTILAMVMIASVWYTANLRAQNQVPGDQVDKNETATTPASPGSVPSPEALDQDFVIAVGRNPPAE